jgi:hypothetical protein
MSTTTRRAALAAPALLALAAASGTLAAVPAEDADMIAWCREYLRRVMACNRANPSDAELLAMGDAIAAAEAEIDARPPRTLAGVVAKAQLAALLAAEEPTGGDGEGWHNAPEGDWAQAVTEDLLRLFGAADPLRFGSAPAVAPRPIDAPLLALAAELRAADGAHCAAAIAAESAPDGDPLHAAVEAAWKRWEALAERIAETPAEGGPGMAVKARLVLRALNDGPANVDHLVAESLARDCEHFGGEVWA